MTMIEPPRPAAHDALRAEVLELKRQRNAVIREFVESKSRKTLKAGRN